MENYVTFDQLIQIGLLLTELLTLFYMIYINKK